MFTYDYVSLCKQYVIFTILIPVESEKYLGGMLKSRKYFASYAKTLKKTLNGIVAGKILVFYN